MLNLLVAILGIFSFGLSGTACASSAIDYVSDPFLDSSNNVCVMAYAEELTSDDIELDIYVSGIDDTSTKVKFVSKDVSEIVIGMNVIAEYSYLKENLEAGSYYIYTQVTIGDTVYMSEGVKMTFKSTVTSDTEEAITYYVTVFYPDDSYAMLEVSGKLSSSDEFMVLYDASNGLVYSDADMTTFVSTNLTIDANTLLYAATPLSKTEIVLAWIIENWWLLSIGTTLFALIIVVIKKLF